MDSKEIVFRNLNISLKQKHVLKNISGVAKSKEVLGVFGPKGKKLRYTRKRDWVFSLVTIFAKIGGKYLTFWSCQIIRKKTLKNEIISKITIIHGI